MKKKALFCYGTPVKKDHKNVFEKACKINFSIMSDIADAKDYDFEIIPFSKLLNSKKDLNEFDLIYYTGHANSEGINHHDMSLDDFFKKIGDKNEKIVILDSCTLDYLSKKEFPKKIKVIGAPEIYDSSSLAKILYDTILCRGKEFDNITKETFEEMGYNWINVKN